MGWTCQRGRARMMEEEEEEEEERFWNGPTGHFQDICVEWVRWSRLEKLEMCIFFFLCTPTVAALWLATIPPLKKKYKKKSLRIHFLTVYSTYIEVSGTYPC